MEFDADMVDTLREASERSLELQPVSDAGSDALVGMGAATAASIHAPLTAAIMVFELSGDYLIVLP